MAIALRGLAQTGNSNNGGDVTLTFDTITPPLEGDVVVVFGGHGVAVTSLSAPVPNQGSAYTQIGIHTGSAPIFGAWYKRMGATVDTSVLCSGGGNNADASSWACWVLSGVDADTVLDQTTTTAGPTTSTNPDPAAITTQTDGAWVLAMAGSAVSDAAPGTISGYANHINSNRNETNDLSAAGATFENPTADAENPGAWSAWGSGAWYAITAALKPAILAPSGAGAQTLGNLTQAGVAAQVFAAVGVQTLAALSQAGVGSHLKTNEPLTALSGGILATQNGYAGPYEIGSAKYTVLTTTDKAQLHVVKTTTASPGDGDWASQDSANSPRYSLDADDQILSFWSVLARADSADVEHSLTGTELTFGDAAATDKLAQSFTSLTGALAAFRLRFKKTGSPVDNLVFSLQADNSGEPDGTIIESRSIAGGDITTGFVDYYFSLKQPLTVASGDVYWIVMDRSGSVDAVNYYRTEYAATNPYSNGTGATEISGTWTDFTSSNDIGFSLYLADIHVFTQQASGRVGYGVFNPGADTWLTVDELVAEVETPSTYDTKPDVSAVTGAIRADSDVIVAFRGITAGGNDSTFWARRETGSWTRALLTSSRSIGSMMGPDEQDRVYVAIKLTASDDFGLFIILSDNSVSSNVALDTLANTADIIAGPGVIAASKGYVPYLDADGTINVCSFDLADTVSGVSIDTISDNAGYGDGRASAPYVAACLALEGATGVHLLYADDATQDLFHDGNVDGAGETDTEILDAVTVNRVTCRVGTSDLLVIYDDGGTTKFLAIALSTAADGAGIQTFGALTMAGAGLMHPSGAGAQALAGLTQSGAGAQVFSGVGAQALAALLQVGAGDHSESADGAGVQTFAPLEQSGAGAQLFVGTSVQVLDALSQAGVGLEQPSGVGVQGLAALLQNGAGVQEFSGAGAQTFAALIQSGAGAKRIVAVWTLKWNAAAGATSGVGIQTFAGLSQIGGGLQTVDGVGAQVLSALAQAGSGAQTFSGAGAQDLAKLLQAGSGKQIFTAAGVQTLAALTQTGAGLLQPAGVGGQTFAALLQTGAAIQAFVGTGAQVLAGLAQSGVGLMNPSGTAAQILAALTQGGLGVQVFVGSGIQTMASMVQSGAGLTGAATGAGAQALAALEQVGAARLLLSGAGGQALAALLQNGGGIETFTGAGVQALAALLQNGSGLSGASEGAGAQSLAALLQNGSGTVTFSGAGLQVLAGLGQAGVGVMLPSGAGVQTLSALVQAGVGVEIFIGVGGQVFAALTQAGAGSTGAPEGAGAQALAALLQVGVGVMQPSGSGSQALAALIQSGLAAEIFAGAGVQTFGALTQAGSAVMLPAGTGAQIFAALTQVGAGVEVFSGTGSQLLTALVQAGSGAESILGAGAQALAALLQVGAGDHSDVAAGAQVLAALTQSGVGLEHPSGAGTQTFAALVQIGSSVQVLTGTGVQILAALTQLGVGTSLVGAQIGITILAIKPAISSLVAYKPGPMDSIKPALISISGVRDGS